jgi:hypothetical protein
MVTKIKNLGYDAPLEVRYWRHPAELAIIHDVDHSTIDTTEMYTDGSRIGDRAGAAGIIFVNGKLVHQLKFKLHRHCTNNQAEKVTIFKVLEKLEKLQDGPDNDKRKITLDILQKNLNGPD